MRSRRGIFLSATLTVTLAANATEPLASGAGAMTVAGGQPTLLPAFDTLGFLMPYDGDANTNGSLAVSYRETGGTWRSGHPGVRVQYVAAGSLRGGWAGRLFALKPATAYEVQLQFADPDGVQGSTTMVLTAATRPEPRLVGNGRTLHVRANATGAEDGSEAHPFASLRKASDAARAGDTVLLHAGVFRVPRVGGGIMLRATGTADAPVVFRAAGDGEVTFESEVSGLETPNPAAWREEGTAAPGVYSAVCTNKPVLVFHKGDYLCGVDSLQDLVAGTFHQLPVGLFGAWWHAAGRLYVKIPARWNDWKGPAVNPGVAGVRAALSPEGLITAGAHVVIEGLVFQYLGHGLQIQGDEAVVRNCVFRYVRVGLMMGQSGSDRHVAPGPLIEKCDFSCSPTYWFRDWTLGHDYLSSQAIEVEGSRAFGGVVRDCVIHDVENGVFAGSWWSNVCDTDPEITAGWVIERNVFRHIGDDCVELDGGGVNAVVRENLFLENHNAVSCAPCPVGPAWVIRNRAYLADRLMPDGEVEKPGKYDDPYAVFKFNVGTEPKSEGTVCVAYHNSVWIDVTHSKCAPSSRIWGNTPGLRWICRNNIFAIGRGGGYGLYAEAVRKEYRLALDMDYDDLYVPDGSPRPLASICRRKFATIEELRAAGYETHGLCARPAFRDPAKGDFTLPAGNPCQDAGVRIPGVNDDFRGREPDIGAVEQ